MLDYENSSLKLTENIENFEKAFIQDALNKNNGDLKKTSNELDISLRTLYRRINKYSIKIEDN